MEANRGALGDSAQDIEDRFGVGRRNADGGAESSDFSLELPRVGDLALSI